MELIVYAREYTDAGERLLAAIGSLLAKRNYTICRSIGALSGRLRKRFFHPETGVLLASSPGGTSGAPIFHPGSSGDLEIHSDLA